MPATSRPSAAAHSQGRPWASCVDDCFTSNYAAVRDYAGDAVAVALDAGHGNAVERFDAQPPRRGHIAHDHAVGVGQAVAGTKGAGDDVIGCQQRDAAAHLVAVEPLGRYAQAPLQRHIVPELGDVAVVGQQKEIAVTPQADCLPRFFFEAVEHGQAELGEPDIDFGGELVADAAGAFAGGAHPEKLLFLKEQDVGHAAPRQVIGGAGAHDAAADDDDLGGGG